MTPTTFTGTTTITGIGLRQSARVLAIAHEHPIEDLDAELGEVVVSYQQSSYPADDQATRLRAILAPTQAPARPPEPSPTHIAATQPSPAPLRGESTNARDLSSTERSCKVVTIASGKGGVGKTTLAVNLAIALTQRGHRVTLFDADLGTANADLLCGLSPRARLEHVFAPDCAAGSRWHDAAPKTLRDIAVAAPGGFRLIPGSAGIARMADLSDAQRRALVGAFHELEEDCDVLIVDTAAGVGPDVMSMMSISDIALVVATPEPTSVADAYALIKCGVASQSERSWDDPLIPEQPNLALVINQAIDAPEAKSVHARIAAVADRFLGVPCPMLGHIAQDVRVGEAVRAREPLVLRSPGTTATHHILALADALAHRLALAPLQPASRAAETPVPGPTRGLVRRLLGY